MALISQSDLEARLGRTLTTDEATDFANINNAVQSHVERIIGSSVESASETTRYYDGGEHSLIIDPCTAITAVKYVDEDRNVEFTHDSSDYFAEPNNRTMKFELRYRLGKWTLGINNVEVTAKFSIFDDEDMRNIVKNAMLDFLASEITNHDNIQRESIEGYSIWYAKDESKKTLESIYTHFQRII